MTDQTLPAGASLAPSSNRASSPAGLAPRTYHGINWTGLRTLYVKEVRRFWKVGMQTIAAPVVTTLLYMMIFVVAMKGARPMVEGVPFAQFVAPGLVMMAILNNAFANSSSSLIQAKIMGTAPDFLTPPLSPFELAAGFSLGAATRGVLVGAVTAASVWPFAQFSLAGGVLRRHRLADDGLCRRADGPVVREVRSPGGGDQLHRHAHDLPVGHLLQPQRPA
jgi:ABC-2 type transport system permease protein